MRVIDIEDVVYAMRNQTQFVLRCEEVFHDKISSAAAALVSDSRVTVEQPDGNLVFIPASEPG